MLVPVRAHGHGGHTLRRGIERGFRGSTDYAEWSHLPHRFYDPLPSVLHYGEDLAAQGSKPPWRRSGVHLVPAREAAGERSVAGWKIATHDAWGSRRCSPRFP